VADAALHCLHEVAKAANMELVISLVASTLRHFTKAGVWTTGHSALAHETRESLTTLTVHLEMPAYAKIPSIYVSPSDRLRWLIRV